MERHDSGALTVAILAGGKSRRMGENKSFVELAGRPLIEYTLAAAQRLNAPILLVTNTPDLYRRFGVPMVGDAEPGKGSLGGIYSALTRSATTFTLCVACDMPFLNPDLLRYLVSLRTGFDAVVPMIDGQPQGLHAVYHHRCIDPIHESMQRNELRITEMFHHLRVRLVGEAAIRTIDPDLRSFTNLNTPEELERVRRAIEERVPPSTD